MKVKWVSNAVRAYKLYKLYFRILAEHPLRRAGGPLWLIEADACSTACTKMSNGEIGTIIQQLLLHSYSG